MTYERGSRDCRAEYHIKPESQSERAAYTNSAKNHREEMSAFQSRVNTDISQQKLGDRDNKEHNRSDFSRGFCNRAYLMFSREHCKRKKRSRNSEKQSACNPSDNSEGTA